MGQHGPVPKRSEERRRRNKQPAPTKAPAGKPKPKAKAKRAPKAKPAAAATAKRADGMRPAKRTWHPIAKEWYESLDDSGQSQFYEPSDWMGAFYVAEVMSRHLKTKRLSAQLFAGVWSAMGELLTTEGARRRARIELEREAGDEKPAGVTALSEYRDRLSG